MPENGDRHLCSRHRAIALTAYAGEINQQQAIAAAFQVHRNRPINKYRNRTGRSLTII